MGATSTGVRPGPPLSGIVAGRRRGFVRPRPLSSVAGSGCPGSPVATSTATRSSTVDIGSPTGGTAAPNSPTTSGPWSMPPRSASPTRCAGREAVQRAASYRSAQAQRTLALPCPAKPRGDRPVLEAGNEAGHATIPTARSHFHSVRSCCSAATVDLVNGARPQGRAPSSSRGSAMKSRIRGGREHSMVPNGPPDSSGRNTPVHRDRYSPSSKLDS